MSDVYVCRTCGIDWPSGEWRTTFGSRRRLHKHMERHANAVGWWDHYPDPRSGQPPPQGAPLWMTRCHACGEVFVADTAYGARLQLWEHCHNHHPGLRPNGRTLRLTDREERLLRRHGARAAWPGRKRDRPLGLSEPTGRTSALGLIAFLTAIAPCPVFEGFPNGDYPRRSRSVYFPRRRGRWHRDRDFILMNERYRSWDYALTLAHELGHALDYHGRHPLQRWLTGRQNRYRQELAATSMSFLVVTHLELHLRLACARRFLGLEREYLDSYMPAENAPTWDDLPLHDVDPFVDLL